YVYFFGGFVGRYDTHGPFADTTSWSFVEVSAGVPNGTAVGSVAFDGRYIYGATLPGSNVVRYDTQGALENAASWTTFDSTPLGPGSFDAIAYDGTYVYFKAYPRIARYRPASGAFGVASSWSVVDLTPLGLGTQTYLGATFDGRYLYLAPA